ncbi:MAG: RluA family pseudouridine synthase [Spirochaetales bacterium]|nr:RluA family pseudouridine synthase [Spirochaetales bacterium]
MNDSKYKEFIISVNDVEKRVDNIIRRFLPEMPLAQVFKHIRSGDIRINSKKTEQSYRVSLNDKLWIYKPLLLGNTKTEIEKSAKKLNTKRIILENNHLLIYNKEPGLLVHGDKVSLDVLVREYLVNKVEKSLSFSPGPLHRLDRNTEGIIVFSKSLHGARTFTDMLTNNLIEKYYVAIVDGVFTKTETFRDNLSRDEKSKKSFESEDGKLAISTFIPLLNKNNATLALIKIETGRTHQIRVQCAIHNRPLLGDIKYNSKSLVKGYYLSAISLTFLEKSDIVNEDNVLLNLSNTSGSLLRNLFTKDEISLAETLVIKELKK